MANPHTPTDYNTPGSSGSLFELGFDENAKLNLKSAATVGGVAAIAILINAGLSIVSFVIEKTRPDPMVELEGYETVRRTSDVTGIMSLVIGLAVSFLLFFFLNKFSSQTKTGLATSNSGTVSEGLGNLANYVKTLGIIFIIILCFGLLGLFALLGVASSR